jgi:periplasmic protein TonB
MLNALEDEPENKGRWRRLGIGSLIALGIAGGSLYTAQHYAPARRILNRVVQMTIQVPLAEKNEPPPPPLPPPPPPKPRPQAAKKESGPKPVEKVNPTPQVADPQNVGLDVSSFGGGGDGPGFHVGGNQMGDPAAFGALEKPKAPVLAAPVREKLTFARALRQEPPPAFSERARKLGIEGLIIFELDIDEHGRVRGARIRKGLEPKVDEETLALVRRWTFQPGRRAGRAVPTTQLFRYRHRLER